MSAPSLRESSLSDGEVRGGVAYRSLGHRQREREGRARAEVTLHPDASAVQLDELAAEREPEPGALGLLLRFADLLELLAYRFVILRRDADAGVRHRDLHTAVRQRRAHVDASPLGRELHGVGEQVQQYLLHLARV